MDASTPTHPYSAKNDQIRIDQTQELDVHAEVAVMTFFRQLGVPHYFPERVRPLLSSGDSTVFLAVRDRPWPPWGLGGMAVAAFCQIHAVSTVGVGISPVYLADKDATNLGLLAAVYAEVLEELTQREEREVNYLVLEGSGYASRVLRSVGFAPSGDRLVTDEHRYVFHRADAGELREQLGLDKVSIPELLALELDDQTFERLGLYLATLQLAAQPTRVSSSVTREIIGIDGGLFDALPPGGVGGVGCFAMPEQPPAEFLTP